MKKNLITLEKDKNILVSSSVLDFAKPEAVYIPLPLNASLTITNNAKVSIGSVLFQADNVVGISPISGYVKGLTRIQTLKEITNAIVIGNDYEERYLNNINSKLSLNKIPNENIINTLRSVFHLDLTNQKNLIINSLDDEPYVQTENFYLLLYYEEILELLDKISTMFELENIILCVKSTSSENLNKLMNCLGMYPNIKLVITPDLYLLGRPEFLLNHLDLKSGLVIKASFLYDMYNVIVKNKPRISKLITISGNGIENPVVVQVKIGTSLKSVITNFIKLKNTNVVYYANGIMHDEFIDITDFVITEAVDSIIIMQKEIPKSASRCINCGMCEEICPVYLKPLYFIRSPYLKYAKEKCIRCGLCSYICPAHIDFNKSLKENKNGQSTL